MSTTKQSGFTLIELLLYVGIVGSLLTSVVFFFALMVDGRLKSQSINEVNQQGVAVMDYITQTIRSATSITTPAAGGSGASLTLVVPTGALSPTIFDLSSGVLRVKEGAGAATALNSNEVAASSVTFKTLTRSGTAGIVQVSFVLSRSSTNTQYPYSYQRTFTGSAEIKW